jgi:hypothetical protein
MKSELLSIAFANLRTARFLIAIVAIVIGTSVESSRANGWTRGLPIGEVGADERKAPESFVLEVWSGDDDGHVYGLCMYFNGKSVPSTIEGIETSDGDFYPQVSFQVADNEQGSQWKTIEASISRPGKSTKLTVAPKSASKALKVDLDVFRPYIGKGKYGRLLLKTGESAVFQIDDLQPPEKKTDSSADAVKVTK